MKTCKRCDAELPLAEFAFDSRNKDGHAKLCYACQREYAREYRQRPEVRAKQWERNLWAHYRMRPEDYERLLESQGGTCGGCDQTEGLGVNSDSACCPKQQTCGQCVLGILCGGCRQVLSRAQGVAHLRKMADYLERGRAGRMTLAP